METSAQTCANKVQQTESKAKPDLQAALHAATRSKHADLNRSIMHRLPLGLPPHATTPLPYHLGMLAFASIYRNLERAVDEIRQEQTIDLVSQQDRLRHVEIIEKLCTKGLPRTHQLEYDAQTLHKRLLHTQQFPTDSIRSFEETERHVQKQAQASTLHIYQRIKNKPYLSLAYSWAMYLALFNGGRWLLKQLESAGPDFWLESQERDSILQSITTLSFWRFETATLQDPNAEQLKKAFKQNFDIASSLLTENEAAEVVEEGMAVFDTCSGLIEVLDICIQEIESQATSPKVQMDTISNDKEQPAPLLWQTFESVVLSPAYQIMRRIWTQSSRSEVSIAVG